MLYSVLSIYDVGSSLGIGTADLDSTLLSLIRWFLGIMTLIAVIAIAIGGADYMVSGSSEVVRERAIKIIKYAVIGLIVCLLAWAAVFFFAQSTANVTQPYQPTAYVLPAHMPHVASVIDAA